MTSYSVGQDRHWISFIFADAAWEIQYASEAPRGTTRGNATQQLPEDQVSYQKNFRPKIVSRCLIKAY